jgi:hypothetical protein
MLLLVTVIGVSLGWTIHKAREQGIAVAALKSSGYFAAYADGDSLTILERFRMWQFRTFRR